MVIRNVYRNFEYDLVMNGKHIPGAFRRNCKTKLKTEVDSVTYQQQSDNKTWFTLKTLKTYLLNQYYFVGVFPDEKPQIYQS